MCKPTSKDYNKVHLRIITTIFLKEKERYKDLPKGMPFRHGRVDQYPWMYARLIGLAMQCERYYGVSNTLLRKDNKNWKMFNECFPWMRY